VKLAKCYENYRMLTTFATDEDIAKEGLTLNSLTEEIYT
jgi:hypothetical protein